MMFSRAQSCADTHSDADFFIVWHWINRGPLHQLFYNFIAPLVTWGLVFTCFSNSLHDATTPSRRRLLWQFFKSVEWNSPRCVRHWLHCRQSCAPSFLIVSLCFILTVFFFVMSTNCCTFLSLSRVLACRSLRGYFWGWRGRKADGHRIWLDWTSSRRRALEWCILGLSRRRLTEHRCLWFVATWRAVVRWMRCVATESAKKAVVEKEATRDGNGGDRGAHLWM